MIEKKSTNRFVDKGADEEGGEGAGGQRKVGVDDGTVASIFGVGDRSVERRPEAPQEDGTYK